MSPERRRLIASDYLSLVGFLTTCTDEEVTLSFEEIQRLLGKPLPMSAFVHAWWRRPGRPWSDAGWVVKRANGRQRRVTFVRQQAIPPTSPT
jgi:hypothetical protein